MYILTDQAASRQVPSAGRLDTANTASSNIECLMQLGVCSKLFQVSRNLLWGWWSRSHCKTIAGSVTAAAHIGSDRQGLTTMTGQLTCQAYPLRKYSAVWKAEVCSRDHKGHTQA